MDDNCDMNSNGSYRTGHVHGEARPASLMDGGIPYPPSGTNKAIAFPVLVCSLEK